MKPKKHVPLNFKERNHFHISLLASLATFFVLFLGLRWLDYRIVQKPMEEAAREEEQARLEAEERARTPIITTADVIAVGDNLYHSRLYNSGMNTDPWNYDHVYQYVTDDVQAADVAIIDQETVLTSDHNSVSTYPSFATPTEVADAVIKAGFDVIQHASNHIDDYGYDFMQQTFDFWKTKYPEIPILGIHETQEDADSIKTITVNDITIAFLNYTYGTNNSGAGEGREYAIDIFDKAKITASIQRAKEVSDCIIFIAHWGTEDETMPNEFQKQWATFLLQQGVDVIIGGHPHVLQPYGRMSDEQGNEMVVFYSLGNFVSTQQELPELLGGMAKFTIQKTVLNGETSIEILSPKVDPLVMHYNHNYGIYAAYMLEDYTEELASQHSVRELIGDEFTLENLYKKYEEIMNMNVKPSTNTNLLNIRYNWDGSMIDKTTGMVVEDTESIQAWEYYAQFY